LVASPAVQTPTSARAAQRVPEHYAVTPWNIDGATRYWSVIRCFSDLYRPDLEILEVGSGSAGVTEFLAHPVTGLDTAFERTAAIHSEHLTPVEGSAHDLPFPDDAFEVVLCCEMMEHLPPEQRPPAFREMLRVLRPGGRMVVTFPADKTAARLDAWLNRRYRRRHAQDHPWAVEHLEHGVPRTDDVRSLVQGLLEPDDELEVRKQAWAPAWKLQQLLFSVEWGYPWTRAVGIHTKPTAKLLFRMLRHLNSGDCYRTMLVVSKRASA
jgi:SAM-dependent methyltransferase